MSGRLSETTNVLALLRSELDDSARIDALSLKDVLSVAVMSRYRFHALTFFNQPYVLATPFEPFTVDRMAADFATIEAKTGMRVIATVPTLTPYFRKALIARRVPFLLDGKQAFLPFVYLNLAASKPARVAGDFTPATQMVFLALLYSGGEARAQSDLIVQLGLSAMSVSRAVEQLASQRLIEVVMAGKTGRRKVIHVADLVDYYRLGMPLFGRAVKQSIHCVGPIPEGLPRSGLDALSRRTLLNPPERPSFAAGFRHRSVFAGAQIDSREAFDRPDSFRVDLLRYDPSVMAIGDLVDPVTMVLTVNEHDERIDQSIRDYMKGFPWYSA